MIFKAIAAFVVLAVGSTALAQPRDGRTAPPVAPEFSVGTTTAELRPACAPTRVASHVIARLDAFDWGRGRAFARGFQGAAATTDARFAPYGDERLPARFLHLRPPAGITRMVRALHRRGDGWTALRLQPPASSDGRVAIYGLFVRVARPDAPAYETGVKLIIDCRTGRFIRWLGPVAPPDPCAEATTRTVVSTLLDAVNAGDVELVDRLVAKGDAFKWYSAPPDRFGEAARDRSTLTSYIAARHAQGESFRLIRFRYQGPSEGRRYANFNTDLVRSARDYPAREVPAKGAIDCKLTPPQVAVWSIGGASS